MSKAKARPKERVDSPAPQPAVVAKRAEDPVASTRSLAPTHRHTLVPRIFLLVNKGPDAGLTFSSTGDRAVIGTHESADLVLHDDTVSRFHCEIAMTDRGVTIRDLGSHNGTVVDGVRVESAYLHPRASIVLGATQLGFDVGKDQIEVPLSARQSFGTMVGGSVPMRRVFSLLEKAAASDATVILTGETGTGKEAAAESIHGESARKGGPFVVVDCGAIPPNLLESELFGHDKGSFTGAVGAREGVFEAASGGTLFLDEIGELPLDLQPKLLRALERREIKRIGTNRYVPINVRVIAATNRDLKSEVNQKRFRSDLYYRLAVIEVLLPPLRQRTEDLPMLVDVLLGTIGASDRPEANIVRTEEFQRTLSSHAWPGNVRELRNYVERCLALEARLPIEPAIADGEVVIDGAQPLRVQRDAWCRGFERRYLEAVLARHEGNVTASARTAGVDRIHFYRLLWRNGLR